MERIASAIVKVRGLLPWLADRSCSLFVLYIHTVIAMSVLAHHPQPFTTRTGGAGARELVLSSAMSQVVWRGDKLSSHVVDTVPSGWPALDQELPASGWPRRSVPEVLTAQPSVLEWRILSPGLKPIVDEGGQVVVIGPPRHPHLPGLLHMGLSDKQFIWIQADSPVSMVGSGICVIKASQLGNSNFEAANSVMQNIAITPGANAITFGPQTPSIQTYLKDGTFALNPVASASTGLPVTYPSDSAPVCTIAGTTVSMVGAGNCVIKSSQPGNSNFEAASSVMQNISITPGANTVTFAAQTPGSQRFTKNGTFELSPAATASSGLVVSYTSDTPTVCTISGTMVTMVAPGNCTISASQAGDGNYVAAAAQSQSVVLQQASMNVVLNSTPNPSLPGQEVTFSVTVSPNEEQLQKAVLKAGPAPAPTGTLTLTDGGTTLGTATLDAAGSASLLVKTLTTPGTHTVVASYSGDANYPATESAAFTQTIAAAAVATPVPLFDELWVKALLAVCMDCASSLYLRTRRA